MIMRNTLSGLALAGMMVASGSVLAQNTPPAGPASISPPSVVPVTPPTDPFAAVKAGTMTPSDFQAQYQYMSALDPNDPFHNWAGNLWMQTETGQWQTAYEAGKTFEQFWDSLQGVASPSLILATPYPYMTAQEHWDAWKAAANMGAGPSNTAATAQDWSGRWGGTNNYGVILRDYYNFASDEYKERYVQSVQAEIESRQYWPGMICLPNGYQGVRSFAFTYADVNGSLVHLNTYNPGTGDYKGRYIWIGYDFTDDAKSYMGESRAFWDGDELVVYTRNIFPQSYGHYELAYSGEMQLIERYYKTGDTIMVDVTRYDPVAYSGPMHSVSIFTKRDYVPQMVEECDRGNNGYYDQNGLPNLLAVGQPGYQDRFDEEPWLAIFKASEVAKANGIIPPTPSIMDLAANGN